MSLTDALILYRDSGIYPFHMPGHKRNSSMLDFSVDYGMDITEIDGFDNLHDAYGILANGMKKAAILYGSNRTFYLVNGSTCGILAGIFACTKKGDKVLVARNCHRAVYHAIMLNELDPVYLLPPIEMEFGINGSIPPEAVEKALKENAGIKLVILTSPTYEGVVSDIKSIVEVVHKRNIPLFVDEAHGAHFGFSDFFPESSVQCGADIVVHSLHKTLPSPTQTALLHINGNLVDAEEVHRQLSIFETSSPSYLLMTGIDSCVELLSKQKDKLFQAYIEKLRNFYHKTNNLEHIKVLSKENNPLIFDFDGGKIVISVRNTTMTGTVLKNILLNKYLIQLEMAMGDYALAMTSICDTEECFNRFAAALLEIDCTLLNKPAQIDFQTTRLPEKVLSVFEANNQCGQFVSLSDGEGKITKEYVYAYPPGIPLLVPGERISKEVVNRINELILTGVAVKSGYHRMPDEINIVQIQA